MVPSPAVGAESREETNLLVDHLLEATCPTIVEDLALDEALLLAAEEERAGPVLRLWEPAEYAVVLGASGRIAQEVHRAACLEDRIPILRRSSGGGTVVIGPGTLNFAVVLPFAAVPGSAAVDVAQRYVLERCAGALRAAGRPVEVLGSGDLTLERCKVAGSAQRRSRRHFMVHATILNDFRLERIARYLTEPRRQPAYRGGRGHHAFVTNLGLERRALIDALRTAWLVPDAIRLPLGTQAERVRLLVATKYGDPAWIDRF